MNITRLNRICPGKRHAWYQTDERFEIRKPLQGDIKVRKVPQFKNEIDSLFIPKDNLNRKSWFRRLIDWIYGYFK